MTDKKDSTSRKTDDPNNRIFRMELIRKPKGVLESALIDTIKLYKYKLHLDFMRDPHSLPGSLEYLLYWDVGRLEPDYIGKIGLSEIGENLTKVQLESAWGVQWITVFEKVIDLWKNRYEVIYPAIMTIQAPPPYMEDMEKVREYSLKGNHTIEQIGRKVGISVSTVNRYRKRLGIRSKQ